MNIGVKGPRLTPYEIKVFNDINESTSKKPHYCDPHCSHLKDKTCGNSYFRHESSSAGRWVKEIDSRCWEI